MFFSTDYYYIFLNHVNIYRTPNLANILQYYSSCSRQMLYTFYSILIYCFHIKNTFSKFLLSSLVWWWWWWLQWWVIHCKEMYVCRILNGERGHGCCPLNVRVDSKPHQQQTTHISLVFCFVSHQLLWLFVLIHNSMTHCFAIRKSHLSHCVCVRVIYMGGFL